MTMPFRVAAAQTISTAGDIEANVECHLKFLREASERAVRLVVFPELSLTGYEPTLAARVAIEEHDRRLAPLREACVKGGMFVVVGAPMNVDGRVRIAALVLTPHGTVTIYTKKYLHPGEEPAFAPGMGGGLVAIDNDAVAIAICADTSHPEHAQAAASRGADLYVASSLITEAGYANDTALLQNYASEYRFPVLMANHGGKTGGWLPIGKSAFWAPDGSCVVVAPNAGCALLIANRETAGWRGEIVTLPGGETAQ